MKLYQIEYFLAVCKFGSVSKAADGLMVSRPAVSRAIKDLEDEFGIGFFQRMTTGVVLTEAGQVFHDKCLRIRGLIDELKNEIDAMKAEVSGENDRVLHLGLSFTARCCILPFLGAFRKQYPDIQLRLSDLEDSFIDVGALLPDYDLEIALTRDETYDGVEYIEVEESGMCFCCSRNHPLAGRSTVSIFEIRSEPLGGLNHLEAKNNQIMELFGRYGLTPNVAYMTQQVSFLKQMIRENLCCAVKPRQSIENDPDIATIPILEAERLPLRILWNTGIHRSSAFNDFLSFAKQQFPRKPN